MNNMQVSPKKKWYKRPFIRWPLDDTPHTQGLYKHADEYKKKVISFFDSSVKD